MTRLIDADALLEAYKNSKEIQTYDYDIARLITNAPTVQREGLQLERLPYNKISELIPENMRPVSAAMLDFANLIMEAMISAAPKE